MTGHAKCSFSIDHILNVAGTPPVKNSAHEFEWLNCTRYKPPKIQRQKKVPVPRRNAGRNPRIPFSPTQVTILENKFQETPYLSGHEVQELALLLGLSDTRVKIWFQNRRARERREQFNDKTIPKTDEGIIKEINHSEMEATLKNYQHNEESNTDISKTQKPPTLAVWSTMLAVGENSRRRLPTNPFFSISHLLYQRRETEGS